MSLSWKIPDKIFIDSSNDISFDFLGKISFVYLVFSSVPNFWSNRVIFFFALPLFASFRKYCLLPTKNRRGRLFNYPFHTLILIKKFHILSGEKNKTGSTFVCCPN